MKKALQYHSRESLAAGRGAKPEDVLRFLEDFRNLKAATQSSSSKSILISMKVPDPLLKAFRLKCEREGVKYQTQIKELMTKWIGESR